jgi:2-polyprenyl-3-methyl-5-hydroxy-6-metoxy-1,4-benzoquinol methylase
MEALEAHLLDQIERSQTFFWHRLRWRAVASYLPADEPFRLVDVGAGAGILGASLHRDFPGGEYLFVEPIASLEQHLERTFGPKANASRLESYEGVRFVTLMDVLEHQSDDEGFLARLVDKMEPGATLMLTVPASMRLWSDWDVALGHHRRYDRVGLRALLDGVPVRVHEVSYLFPELVPAAWLRKWKLRHRPAQGTTEEAQFPQLPGAINASLYGLGRATLRMRRRWPAGTSLLAVGSRT